MVTNCFYHPKVEGANTCRRCMIPLCEECTTERYCPECHKMAMYVRDGQSGRRKANLVVEDNQRRASLTKQLMINRLAKNVLADLPAATPVRGTAASPRAPGKIGRGWKASASKRNPGTRTNGLASLAASALALVCAFSLGSFFSRPPAQAAGTSDQAQAVVPGTAANEAISPSSDDYVPVANRPEALSTVRIADYSSASGGQVAYPVRPAIANRAPEPAPAQAYHRPVEPGFVPSLPKLPKAYAAPAYAAPAYAEADAVVVPDLPAVPPAYHPAAPAAHPVRAAAPRPTLALAWPVAGNTLRMTSYVKVNVANPGQVSVLNVTVDGRTVAPLSSVGSRNEIPVDTTQIANGDHRLQVMAMTESGDIVASDPVTVTVSN
jgi:hypothetical protein